MSADLLLSRWTRAARVRGATDVALLWVPLALVVGAAAWRWQGVGAAAGLLVVGGAAVALHARRSSARYDSAWLARRLDAERGELEDSSALLFADADALGPLARLQRARLAARLDASAEPSPARPTRWIVAAWLAAAAAIAAILLWPPREFGADGLAPAAEGGPVIPGVPRLVAQRLRVIPPGYTGLAPRDLPRLDARAPAGSRLVWTLRFAPQAGAATLGFLTGAPQPLAPAGDDWTASRILTASALYRVVPKGGRGTPPLHRLDAIPDTPPRVAIVVPDRILSMVTPGQRSWTPVFAVADDYGVAAGGSLRVTTTIGEGENISFKIRTIAIAGRGPARRKTFAARIDLAAFGLAKGGDLVVQLTARDNRAPGPQAVTGPSLILRWPPDAGVEGGGIDGMVRNVVPAYFRSQRQIIIDAEGLLKQRRRLAANAFLEKSNTIGSDQHILRMRYGQFMGDESEGASTALPTNDEEDAAAAPEPHADDDDGHDHEAPSAPTTFGDGSNVVAEYGDLHDQPEAATLLDPGTRSTLRQALDNMWQSELHLRQGAPDQALPYAYKALALIKQVQQATRIYLARVGSAQPELDQARRLTGKRDGIARRELAPIAQAAIDVAPQAAWGALADTAGPAGGTLDALERWLAQNRARVADPLAFAGAIDAVRRDPRCARCRGTLRGLVWSVLPRPVPAGGRRDAGDGAGRRYLDALRGGR